jgi:carbon storage regulator
MPLLALNRKLDERIVIGDSIVVTVISVCKDRVRLGIEAPPQVPVLRQELQARPRLPTPEHTVISR